jgi:hypothetical protein
MLTNAGTSERREAQGADEISKAGVDHQVIMLAPSVPEIGWY